jgi:hypothetical protein
MKPFTHAMASVRRHGGKPMDYQEIHDFLDMCKAAHADVRHRAILHNSMGPFICEKVFGVNIKNSDGRLVSVRDIAEEHIVEDLGRIPPVSDYLEGMPHYDWLAGNKPTISRKIVIED